jgi:hypothetical protein
MNDYLIPNLIVANNEVIDGKQRIIAIQEFKNNTFR